MSFLSFLNPSASLGKTYLEGKNNVAKAKSAAAIIGIEAEADVKVANAKAAHKLADNGQTQDFNLDSNNIVGVNHITASGNISSSGQFIIGRTGSFAKMIINSDLSGASEPPFLISIPDTNGQNQKLQVNHEGVLRFGALNTLPTAVTGGLVYSASSFYMGLP